MNRRWVLRVVAMLWLMLGALSAQAAIEAYEFRNDGEREQFKVLITELRCPKCQNQNLADSNAPIAKDMRERIYEMIQQGESTQGIIDFMVDRYGDFVNYRPRRDSSTAVLWYAPLALLFLGLAVVVLVSRRRRSARQGEAAQPKETAVDRERLKKILDDNDNPPSS